MSQQTVTIIVASFGIAGTLGGIVVGHFLSRSWQREQWMRDRRHEEIRELMVALAASMHAEVETVYQSELTEEERKDKGQRTADFFQIAQTRIFTYADVERLDIKREWLAAVNAHLRSRPLDLATFEKSYEALARKLVECADVRRTNRWLPRRSHD